MNATATKTSSKTNAAAPAAAANAPAFLLALSKHVTPIQKLSSAQATQDPTLAMRTRFANHVADQIKLIQSAASKSRWFSKLPDGSYELTVRNSNAALKLGEATFFQAKDATAAVAFLEAVAAGAKAGELDEQLKATSRKPAARKPKAAPGAPASAAAVQK